MQYGVRIYPHGNRASKHRGFVGVQHLPNGQRKLVFTKWENDYCAFTTTNPQVAKNIARGVMPNGFVNGLPSRYDYDFEAVRFAVMRDLDGVAPAARTRVRPYRVTFTVDVNATDRDSALDSAEDVVGAGDYDQSSVVAR